MNIEGYNDVKYDPNKGNFDPIPPGEYEATIIAEEDKVAKSGNGEYVKLTVQVLSGPYKGRLLWENLNLVHTNDQTVEIAAQTLASIRHATGVDRPKTTAELLHKPIKVKVKIRPAQGQWGPQNEITSYMRISGGGSGEAQTKGLQNLASGDPAPAPAPAPDNARATEAPWM